jgi:hypothetical protein
MFDVELVSQPQHILSGKDIYLPLLKLQYDEKLITKKV